jgi:hypothetical protein
MPGQAIVTHAISGLVFRRVEQDDRRAIEHLDSATVVARLGLGARSRVDATDGVLPKDRVYRMVGIGRRDAGAASGVRSTRQELGRPFIESGWMEHVWLDRPNSDDDWGRTVDEWKLRPERADNHLLDCLVGAAVGASMQGISLDET